MASVNPPWTAYSPPPPTTPPFNIDKFSHLNSPVPEGHVTGFGCDTALDVIPNSKEEDTPPPLENITPIPIVVDCGIFRVRLGDVDFIPFEVHGQCCKQSKGILTSTYHLYCNRLIKGQCHHDPGGWCVESDCCGGRPF